VIPYTVQKNDPGSLLNFYKKIIQYRNTSRPLTRGDIDHSGIGISEIVSFKRKFEDEEELVLHNVSDVEVTVNLQEANRSFKKIAFKSKEDIELDDRELTLPAYSTVILK
jgi:glycosidase